MAIEQAREYLTKFGLDGRIQEFDVSSATVPLAAAALCVIPARIGKTMSFLVDSGAVLIVTAGDARIDNAKYKSFFHTKATMLTPEQAEEMVGHAVGGVCPFGVKDGVPVYLDCSLQRFDTVFPAAGSANSAVEVSPAELFDISSARAWIDVCKDWENRNEN